jgi:hypothetical protein
LEAPSQCFVFSSHSDSQLPPLPWPYSPLPDCGGTLDRAPIYIQFIGFDFSTFVSVCFSL